MLNAADSSNWQPVDNGRRKGIALIAFVRAVGGIWTLGQCDVFGEPSATLLSKEYEPNSRDLALPNHRSKDARDCGPVQFSQAIFPKTSDCLARYILMKAGYLSTDRTNKKGILPIANRQVPVQG